MLIYPGSSLFFQLRAGAKYSCPTGEFGRIQVLRAEETEGKKEWVHCAKYQVLNQQSRKRSW